MTPQQQADYDYAMSQLKPKCKVIELASIPMITIRFDTEKFQDAVKLGQETARAYRDKLDAIMFAMTGVPKDIFLAPNCRCTIKNDWEEKGSTTDAKDPKSE